jgi:hypothetical protein
MKIPVRILRRIELLIAMSGLLLCAHPLAAQHHQIVDRPVESFETGLPIPRLGAVFWLDDHQLLTYALPEGAPDVVWTGGDTLTRVVLVNFATKRIQVIAENAVVNRFDQETLAAVIGPMGRKADAREIHVTPEGNVVEIARFAPDVPLPLMQPDFPKDQLVQPLARKADGYLLGDKTKLQEHTRSGTPVPTTWVRPGRPDLPLSVGFEEIGPTIEYVAFLNKYLLNTTDTQMSSNTNSTLNRVWLHPYTYTPFRLLALDGSIEEIPYPRFVSDYGLEHFGELRVTRAGIVVSKYWETDGAIYLFENNQLYRLTRGKSVFALVSRTLPMQGVEGLTPSPDGCSLAYLHFNVPLLRILGSTPRYLALVNVCKEIK